MIRAPHEAEQYRVTKFSSCADGNNGLFFVPSTVDGSHLYVMVSSGFGWDHISVLHPQHGEPCQDDMDLVRGMWFSDQESVVEFHSLPLPDGWATKMKDKARHLWRPQGCNLLCPPPTLYAYEEDQLEGYEEIKSSNISAAKFDAEDETLRLVFHNGSEYEYSRVAKSTFDAFLAAESQGRFFHAHIRSVFPFEKIEADGD